MVVRFVGVIRVPLCAPRVSRLPLRLPCRRVRVWCVPTPECVPAPPYVSLRNTCTGTECAPCKSRVCPGSPPCLLIGSACPARHDAEGLGIAAMGDTVTLVIEFVSGGAVDRAARLLWVNDADEERAYLDIQERATIRQETFPGHRWLVRGQSSNNVLLRMTANHNAEQRFRIDGDAADEVRNALCDAPNIDPAAGEFQAEDVPAGTWVAVSGQARFERVARPAGSRRIEWRELDSAGVETGRLHQVEVHVQTRWLWWLSAAWRRVQSASRGHESLILPLLSVAAAYHVDFALPHWISQATGGRIQLNTLIVLVFLVGAAVAAAFPLQESYIVLFNAATRTEVRLGDHQGHAREPSNRPGHAAAWLPVCEGGFHVLPRELRALRGRQQHHYVVLTVIGVLLARAAVTMP